MTNKEYKEKRDSLYKFEYFDYLRRYDISELRKDINRRRRSGAYELPGSNKRATVRINSNNDIILTSYYTDVCKITAGGDFIPLWSGYSVTTLKHINIFRTMNGLPAINKRDWIEII